MSFTSKGQRRIPKPQTQHCGNARAGKRVVYFNPSQDEVVAAVRSLYADCLEPFGRILLRRVRERRAAASQPICDVDD
eukprot:CAMPEP_0204116398 /NCGR_PEP_ID=MMETSP0361-20130328/5385_1 /ASSEMBLY_ACC=CAM_ASM_000343 /TAXON_ID=268821 /ORGANISM="Scrippsiella Hangoei, Strain SHTV-5" /LENGTH=77 /DNA_ID=CAMNT_0051067183 /DNA_START=86 /DNA_END=316 /DNA_ORIENTATION=-